MKTQRSLPPHQKKKKIIFLQNQGKTQRWRGKQIHNELKTVLTTVDFLGGLAVKNLPANEGDMCSIPGLGRFPGERIGYPLQCSSLENPMDRGAWQASDHGIVKVRQDLETEQLDHCTKKSQCRKLGDTYGSPDHTPEVLLPEVLSLLFLPWSIILKANFSSFPPSNAQLSVLTACPEVSLFPICSPYDWPFENTSHPHPSSAWTSGWYPPPFPIVHLTV